jgi:hypothetical protein
MKISAVSDRVGAARDGRGRDYSGAVEAIRESDRRRVSEPIHAHRAFARKAGSAQPSISVIARFATSSPEERQERAYKIAVMDIHKSVLMVALASTANEVKDATGAAVACECRRFGAGQQAPGEWVKWLQQNDVVEVVMASTAQYGKPICLPGLSPSSGIAEGFRVALE